MRALLTVFGKEFRENLRDRRTLWSALLFGPLFGPLLFSLMVSKILDQNVAQADKPVKVAIGGEDHAPNLVEFLKAHGVEARPGPVAEADAAALVRAGKAQAVLVIPAQFGARFAAGEPAPVQLVADSTDAESRKTTERLRALLSGYGAGIVQARLQVRGVDPRLAMAVAVDDVDVATPAGRAVLVIGMMTYFVLFAMLMGGLYLAIDTTAGERERGSLEALLALPVPRAALVGGKIFATAAYMSLSLAISLAGFVTAFRFVHLDRLGMTANLSPFTALEFFAICLPFAPLGAALMALVASFAKSYREGQTYLSGVLLVPTLPIAFASIYALKAHRPLMLIPSLSQHLLMTRVLRGEPLEALDVLVSAASTLALAALLVGLTVRAWRRERMLG